ncbi:MAG: sulfatase [Bryobacteraceae bacterium]|nr:sulfatase [Bryobacteraceae bacterium]
MDRRQLLGASLAAALARSASPRLNVLFITISDLRPDLGCYGNPVVQSPNLDALAARGTLFNRAYCQFASASQSRSSYLTGRRPDTTRIFDSQTHFRKHLPDVVTLPQCFKQAGYVTTSFGRTYHSGLNDVPSWSIPAWFPPNANGATDWNTPANAERQRKFWAALEARGWKNALIRYSRAELGPSWEARDVPDDSLPDGLTAKTAIQALQTLKDQPFFLSIGFQKPHLPFVAPKRYYDLYARKKIEIPDYAPAPTKVPPLALHSNQVLRSYQDIPETGPIPEAKALEIVRAYYASISYIDAQVGRVLRALDRTGLREQTIVIVAGDVGWHLGNHGLWHKHSNFEKAVRTSLIVSAPGQKQRGTKTDSLAELVDLYPTLTALTGVTPPKDLEGTSFAPMLDNPARKTKSAAFSQFPRNVEGVGTVMGYTVRTERYRYTDWRAMDAAKTFRAYELYDYLADPQETANIVDHPDHAKLRRELHSKLNAGWRAA